MVWISTIKCIANVLQHFVHAFYGADLYYTSIGMIMLFVWQIDTQQKIFIVFYFMLLRNIIQYEVCSRGFRFYVYITFPFIFKAGFSASELESSLITVSFFLLNCTVTSNLNRRCSSVPEWLFLLCL